MSGKKTTEVVEGQKKATDIAVAETKELDFGDLELKINKPSMNKDNTIIVSGNFAELGRNIKAVVDRYKDTVLTEDNVDYVATLKKQFVSLRTGIELDRKNYKKAYLSPAEDLLDSMCKELLKIVDEGESALGKQLEEYDQRRKDELTVVLTEYVNDAVEKFALREEYASQIQLKKQYYNKTQKEEDSIDDINLQAEELSKKQKDYDNGVELIRMECEDAGLLPDSYIRELNYKVASEIILEIKKDKRAKAEMQKEAEEKGKVTIGADADSEIACELAKASEFRESDEIRTRKLVVKYKAEKAKELAKALKTICESFEFL